MDIKIAIDAMGGDFGPKITVPAAIIALQRHPNLKLILVGKRETLQTQLANCFRACCSCGLNNRVGDQIEICDTTEEVAMDESPVKALRFKKDSSMRVTINLVKDGKAQAGVSAGNTGALMAIAHYVLKTLPGVDRPAIITSLPTVNPNKEVHVLDLGANVDSEAMHLYQFAVMGSVLVKATTSTDNPKIGLLNIGSEEIKGNEQVKKAMQLIVKNRALNYVGYVEGDDIFKGDVDVVVCDGFIGNVTLKTVEGIAKLFDTYLRRYFTQNFFTKTIAILATPILKKLACQLDPGRRNGASLIGLRGIVVKSHGGANEVAFANAIEEAIREVEHNVPQNIQTEVRQLLSDETS